MKQVIMPGAPGVPPLDELLARVYPVGAVYMSLDATSPAQLFGGDWVRIEGKFLLAADASHAADSEGGSESVTLTTAQIPAHAHTFSRAPFTSAEQKTGNNVFGATSQTYAWMTSSTANTGGGEPHDNMPPYVAVYVWRRTA